MWLDQQHLEWTEETLWVTDLRRRYRVEDNTRHATDTLWSGDPREMPEGLVTAADVRRWALDELGKAGNFCRHVQDSHGDQMGVVLEPEWLSLAALKRRFPHFTNHTEGQLRKLVAPHIHFQLKKPIRWTTLV
jgi:hypothetical protein